MDIDIVKKLNDWTLRLKYAELGKSTCLTLWVSVPKFIEVIR